jgi:hypothetical protein
MQQSNFIGVLLAGHVSGDFAHRQERQTLYYNMWCSAL